jgi:hypothetical protein
MAAKTEGITVGMRELDRLKTVQSVVDGHLKPGQAADRLGVTARQLRRLVLRYRAEGPSGWRRAVAARPATTSFRQGPPNGPWG